MRILLVRIKPSDTIQIYLIYDLRARRDCDRTRAVALLFRNQQRANRNFRALFYISHLVLFAQIQHQRRTRKSVC